MVLTVWPLCNFGGQDTRRIAAEKLGCIGVLGVAGVRFVVRLRQNLVDIPLGQAFEGASLFDSSGATGNAAVFDSTSAQLIGAVGEIISPDGIDKVSALEDLVGEVVAGMSLN